LASLKDSKRRMYCTAWDIISEIEMIATDEIDISEQSVTNVVKRIGQIESKIYEADDIINAKLRKFYSNFDVDSWATLPVADADNNSISARLRSVYVNNSTSVDPYTAFWTVEITSTGSPVKYSLESSLEGNQGTDLTVTADATSTNGDVTILASAWENTSCLAVGDKFYFSVIDVEPVIHSISVMLTTSMVLRSIFTEESPNASEAAERLWSTAHDLLDKLQRPYAKDGMRLSGYSDPSQKSIPVQYKVSDTGYDFSPYLEEDSTEYLS